MKSIDEQIAQELYFEKYKYKVIDQLETDLKKLYEEVTTMYILSEDYSRYQIEMSIKEIERKINDIFDNVEDDSVSELSLLTAAFLATESRLLGEKFSKDLLKDVFKFDTAIVQGYTLSEMIASVKTSLTVGIRKSFISRTGYESLKGSILKGTSSKMFTALSTYSKFLREETRVNTEKKSKRIKGFISLATLDNRTSPICISLDKMIYKIEEYPSRDAIPNRPPRHFRCRSIIARLYANTKIERDALGDNGKNIVDGRTTFNSFLKRNPKTARDILGKKRFELFESGKYSVKDFISDRGVFFTLEELAKK